MEQVKGGNFRGAWKTLRRPAIINQIKNNKKFYERVATNCNASGFGTYHQGKIQDGTKMWREICHYLT